MLPKQIIEKELKIARNTHKLVTNERENTRQKAYRLAYIAGEIDTLERILFLIKT